MRHNNLNKKNNRYIVTAATIFTLAIMTATASIMATAPAAATATTTEATTTTPPEGIELSTQPVFQEQLRTVNETPINQTHFQITFSGNGTLTLPNTTETISTTTTGSVIVSMEGTAVGEAVISTEDGTENATIKFYEIARFGIEEGTGRGVLIALVHTDSTGRLAPLDSMILAGQQEFPSEEISSVTLWEWQSGIPLPTTATTETTTSTSTNATGVGGQEEATIGAGEGQLSPGEEQQAAEEEAAINTTTAGPPEEEEGGEEEQQQQQQQTAPTIPPAPNPLFE